jgi:hypothetical protein
MSIMRALGSRQGRARASGSGDTRTAMISGHCLIKTRGNFRELRGDRSGNDQGVRSDSAELGEEDFRIERMMERARKMVVAVGRPR